MSRYIDAEAYGLLPDGVEDYRGKLLEIINLAEITGLRTIKLPAHCEIRIGSGLTKNMVGGAQLDFVSGGNTMLVLQGALLFQSPAVVSDRQLVEDVPFLATRVRLDNTAGIARGHILSLDTSTKPISTSQWPYNKQVHIEVAEVNHETGWVQLCEQINFAFTVAETTVSARLPGEVNMAGIGVRCTGEGNALRMDAVDWSLDDATITGNSVRHQVDPFLCTRTRRGLANNVRLLNSRYTMNIAGGSRHTKITQVTARGVRHPTEPNTFAYDTVIEDMDASDTQGAIECHPSFLTGYRRCRDNTQSYGMGLRGWGCWAEDVYSERLDGQVGFDAQSPLQVLSGYEYLSSHYETRHTRVRSPTAGLAATFCRRHIIEECDVPRISADGLQSGIPYHGGVIMDKRTKCPDIDMRRLNVYASGERDQIAAVSDGTYLVLAPRKTPGVGWYPKLWYFANLRHYESDGIPGTTLVQRVKFCHNWGIQEAVDRSGQIIIRGRSSLSRVSKILNYVVYQLGSTHGFRLSLSALQDEAPPAGSGISVAIGNSSSQFGDTSNMDNNFFAFDITWTKANNAAIEHTEIEVIETRDD